MKNCTNFDCTWRYDETQHDHCPKCGEPAPPPDNRPYGWNSTIKVDPSKKPKRSSIKYKKKSGELAESMREKARQHIAEHEGRMHCENCGLLIIEMKYDNISHDLTRGAHPEEALNLENMTVLCCDIDLMLRSSEHGQTSCHTLWERNEIEKYNRRNGKYKD